MTCPLTTIRMLFEVLEKINRKIKEELEQRKEHPIDEVVLPYTGSGSR